jgi:pyruvate-ferredoxin/flavodoxin oxidoreductase
MHGYDLAFGAEQSKLAVDTGYWPLLRFDPRRVTEGKSPMQLDSGPPKTDLAKFEYNETRFRMVENMDRQRALDLLDAARRDVKNRFAAYEQLAQAPTGNGAKPSAPAAAAPSDAAGD